MFNPVSEHNMNYWNERNTLAGFKFELFKGEIYYKLYVHSMKFIF